MKKTIKVEATSSNIKAKVIELIQSLDKIVNVEIKNEVIEKKIEPGDLFTMSYLGKGITITIYGLR